MKGVFLGRICPLHLGHEAIIEKMIETCGIENCLVIIGGSNATLSLRYFFSYAERRQFLRAVFPGIKVVGLPDFKEDNNQWFTALDDILTLGGFDPKEVRFFGGCEEDVEFFLEAGRKVSIVNRFDGSTPKISATEVRDALLQKRNLDGLLNPTIQQMVSEVFHRKWEAFKRM
ncbi:MAG: hypothetical protein UU31_C0011G0003 [Candidatus Uhrbacteria bacterium GW2011_GWA2_41_10]|jgi:nicotinic acid mononucleotide adenylyltransferase|uniref:Cytidyltransferase-like domain-containing protein n=1 Tax=Candidatus Uhrbacteria bacterium GW2011_GWC2_41_11 TaxID=1618985 RepID=A0A0G0UDX6_9BACT|nr:MAG: hypothetical protein UU31_C0011G0003 [Candidatus Uhrbacteria bacterium GW2011_GWA2_41_10]KKR87129.1 MAG: hypothetical protein UU35_C0005G0003 [Candidatus Uhrbacteria bacterium GW2011_GWC2_41_11]